MAGSPTSLPGENDGRGNFVRARLIPFLGKRACWDQESPLFPLAVPSTGSGGPGVLAQLPSPAERMSS